jgi:hypothetical protein
MTIPGLVLVALAAGSLPAHATLGGDLSSVAADQSVMHAQASEVASAAYTDHVLRLPDGIIVHEFVNASGQVFQVTWSGRGHRPNMNQLLGAHVVRMQAPDHRSGPMSRHAEVERADVVIHSAVRARFFTGSAHIPALIPSTLSGPVAVAADGG